MVIPACFTKATKTTFHRVRRLYCVASGLYVCLRVSAHTLLSMILYGATKTSRPSQNYVSTSSDEIRIMSFSVKCLKTFRSQINEGFAFSSGDGELGALETTSCHITLPRLKANYSEL